MKNRTRLSFLLTASTLILAAGCASISARGRREDTLNAAPKWYLNVPQDKAYLRASGTGESPMMSVSVEIAAATARTELATSLKTFVQSEVKRGVAQNTRAGADQTLAVANEQFTSAVVQLVQQDLEGSRIKERKVAVSDKGYVAWVLVELPLSSAREAAAAEAERRMEKEVDERMKKVWAEFRDSFRNP